MSFPSALICQHWWYTNHRSSMLTNLPPALQAVTMLSLHWNGWAWHSMTLAKTMPEAQSHRLLPGHGSSTLADMGMFEGNCSPPVKRIAPTSRWPSAKLKQVPTSCSLIRFFYSHSPGQDFPESQSLDKYSNSLPTHRLSKILTHVQLPSINSDSNDSK